jgi:hypothetical protein
LASPEFALSTPDASVTRTESGQFPKGTSGNPAGRPPGRKGEIVALKQDLEVAIRSHVDPRKIAKIINVVVNKAMNGNLQAAKLILDKVLSNAGETEDEVGGKGSIRIVIENATIAAVAASRPHPPIEGTAEVIT